MDPNTADTAILSPEEWTALITRHGGLVGKKVIDPQVKDPDSTFVGPNPNPRYHYTFKDGTYIESKRAETAPGVYSDASDVTNGGTALKAASGGSSTPYRVVKLPDGSSGVLDEATGKITPYTGTDGNIAQQNADTNKGKLGVAQENANTAQDRANLYGQAIANGTLKAEGTAEMQRIEALGKILGWSDDQKNAKMAEWYQANVTEPARIYAEQAASQATGFSQNQGVFGMAQTAGQNAVANAKDAQINAVGPNFGAHAAQALNGLDGRGPAPQWEAGDFTSPIPDYNAIADQAVQRVMTQMAPSLVRPAIPAYQAPPGTPSAGQVVTAQQGADQARANAIAAGTALYGGPAPTSAPMPPYVPPGAAGAGRY